MLASLLSFNFLKFKARARATDSPETSSKEKLKLHMKERTLHFRIYLFPNPNPRKQEELFLSCLPSFIGSRLRLQEGCLGCQRCESACRISWVFASAISSFNSLVGQPRSGRTLFLRLERDYWINDFSRTRERTASTRAPPATAGRRTA